MWWFRVAAALACAVLLAGCGFHPLNARQSNGDSTVARLSQVQIELIEDRRGQELRNDLLDRLNPDGQPGQPRYSLAVVIDEANTSVAIAKDASTIRNNLAITAHYKLTDLSTGKSLYEGYVNGLNSYAEITNSYSTIVGQKDAESRVLSSMADDISRRLALYFQRSASEQP